MPRKWVNVCSNGHPGVDTLVLHRYAVYEGALEQGCGEQHHQHDGHHLRPIGMVADHALARVKADRLSANPARCDLPEVCADLAQLRDVPLSLGHLCDTIE